MKAQPRIIKNSNEWTKTNDFNIKIKSRKVFDPNKYVKYSSKDDEMTIWLLGYQGIYSNLYSINYKKAVSIHFNTTNKEIYDKILKALDSEDVINKKFIDFYEKGHIPFKTLEMDYEDNRPLQILKTIFEIASNLNADIPDSVKALLYLDLGVNYNGLDHRKLPQHNAEESIGYPDINPEEPIHLFAEQNDNHEWG